MAVPCFGTEDWYPPLKDALTGLTAEEANWKPEGVAVNSIWETASHILFYKERLLAQLQGEKGEDSILSFFLCNGGVKLSFNYVLNEMFYTKNYSMVYLLYIH